MNFVTFAKKIINPKSYVTVHKWVELKGYSINLEIFFIFDLKLRLFHTICKNYNNELLILNEIRKQT